MNNVEHQLERIRAARLKREKKLAKFMLNAPRNVEKRFDGFRDHPGEPLDFPVPFEQQDSV